MPSIKGFAMKGGKMTPETVDKLKEAGVIPFDAKVTPPAPKPSEEIKEKEPEENLEAEG